MISPVNIRFFVFFLGFCLAGISSAAVRIQSKSKSTKSRAVQPAKVTSKTKLAAKTKVSGIRNVAWRASRSRRFRVRNANYVAGGPWLEPTFADSTLGDSIDGEDLMVRRAAVEALGPYNGSVVVADPHTGRLLTVVNQRVAFRVPAVLDDQNCYGSCGIARRRHRPEYKYETVWPDRHELDGCARPVE
jgi:hypothetical protein